MNEKLIELAKAAGFGVDGKGLLFTLGFANSQAYCTDKLERFAELVREDERKSKWQSMDTAPKDRAILVFDQQGQDIAYWSDEGWISYYYRKHIMPTHWQPLPAPPQESETQDD